MKPIDKQNIKAHDINGENTLGDLVYHMHWACPDGYTLGKSDIDLALGRGENIYGKPWPADASTPNCIAPD